MKYVWLFVYQISWGYLNIWILNILEKHDEIVCIWWLIIEHNTLLWEVNTQGENPPGNTSRPLSFGKWIRENMETALPHILQATKSYKRGKVSTASCNFSASWHRDPASWHQEKWRTGQGILCTVTSSSGGHERNFESRIWLPLEVKCTSHDYAEDGVKPAIKARSNQSETSVLPAHLQLTSPVQTSKP